MTSRTTLKATNFEIFPLCLGGNVFGWSADQDESFKVLDTFFEDGGNFIDTADVYSEWKEGNKGGESETILGNWMKSRKNRHELVIATKVAKSSKRPGLSDANIKAAADDSLSRLQTDHIDLYYAHEDDESVEQLEYLRAFDSLIKAGKVHIVGASNFNGSRIKSALQVSTSNNLAQFKAIQNQYNLLDRSEFERDVKEVAHEMNIDSFPFYGVARGFLTGKYQPGVKVASVRAQGVSQYFNERGWNTLNKVSEIAARHGVSKSAIALAWLRAKGQTPIASARTVEQLKEIMQLVQLSTEEVSELDSVSNF